MSSGSIRFVSIAETDSAEEKRARQRNIRSHVTSRHYQQKRIRDAEKNNSKRQNALSVNRSDELPPFPEAHEHMQPLRLSAQSPVAGPVERQRQDIIAPSTAYTETQNEARYRESARLNSYLGQGASDPFVGLPTGLVTSRMGKHLYYYVNILMRQMRPSWTFALVRKRFGCRSFIDADELLLNSLCVCASTSKALLTSDMAIYTMADDLQAAGIQSASFDWLHFRGRTMQIITTRLSNPQDSFSDYTIGAVCELIMSEAFTGNTTHLAMHISGLKRLEQLRRDTTELSYDLEFKILESYTKASALTLTRPTAPFTLSFGSSTTLASMDHVLPEIGSALILKWPELSWKQDFLYILHDIVTTTRYTQAISESRSRYSDEYHERIAYENLYIEHRLLSWNAEGIIEEACRIACLMYVNTSLIRSYRSSAAIIKNLVNTLFQTVVASNDAQVEVDNPWGSCLDVFFWVLFIGAHCSYQQAHEMFFFNSVSRTAALLQLKTWEDARTVLTRYLFIDEIYQETLEIIWLQNT
ncbi:hypothetical protein FHL15_002611 [Xylaria flabelliformis]|uniref:Uncharacterized protein n=1 Tax=Xylaria flabelliformis TaxID=2512241 RepID=A0A553I804_9PEZI|nr:hypothetical protein FHL15_002611 [Xylaria flabelliformis]